MRSPWPQFEIKRPSGPALVAKILIAVYLGAALALMLPLWRSLWPAAFMAVSAAIAGSAIIGLPKRYYLAGVALISIQGLFPLAHRFLRSGSWDWSLAVWVGCTCFIMALLLLIWWVAAEPIWRWRRSLVVDEDGVYIPQAAEEDENALPEVRLQMEVILSRLLIAVFTVFYAAVVLALAWIARAFGDTEGMSEVESMLFVVITLAYPLPAAILCFFRLPLAFRKVMIGLLVALNLSLLFYLGGTVFGGNLLPPLISVPVFLIYGLVWWTATKPNPVSKPALREDEVQPALLV